ncbi:MAG TPA: hypothetical protein PKE63_12345 [Lacibacter sp.]|nr:hypothetical protein [Lacibacter sp.]HMP88060.1 hypothetical protein [Lacibacter sp.]
MSPANPATATYTHRHLLLHLFVVAQLVHFAFAPDQVPVVMGVLVVACIMLLLRPQQLIWPLLGVGITLPEQLGKFPELANHATLELFISLGILFVVLRYAAGRRSPLFTPDEKSRLFCTSAVVVYFLTGFHKLNRGFFDADTSCALHINHYLFRYLGGDAESLPLWLIRSFQGGTLLLELIVPFGLLFARTRRWAVALLFGFHAYLCFFGFANFASFGLFFLSACLLPFDRPPAINALYKPLQRYTQLTVPLAATAYLVCNVGGLRFEGDGLSLYFLGFSALFCLPYLWMAGRVLLTFRPVTRPAPAPVRFRAWLPALLLLAWGTQCYYGTTNRATLTMYSNLVTEAGRSNHLLINTAYTKLFHFEEDYLLLREVSPNLHRFTGTTYHQFSYPLVTFRRRAAHWAREVREPVYIRLQYRGQTYEIRDLSGSPFARERWYDRYLYFRETPLKGYGVCMW